MNLTIKSAQKREREPVIKGATFHAYLVEFEGRDGKCEMLQKPDTPAPKAGDSLDVEITPGKEKDDGTKWPDKAKKIGQSGGGGWKPRDPAETAAIVRQHSQAQAVAYLALEGYTTAYKDIGLDRLKELIDWFDADVASVKVAAQSVETPVAPTEKPREAAPEIPVDRAKKILDAAVEKRLAQVELDDDSNIVGVTLTPSFQTKLIDVGCATGKINNLNVDQAEDVETWIEAERV